MRLYLFWTVKYRLARSSLAVVAHIVFEFTQAVQYAGFINYCIVSGYVAIVPEL